MSEELKNKSIEDLEHRLEALEAQSRFTELQIKETKEELERRKKVLPLGVPIRGTLDEIPLNAVNRAFLQWFQCEASADKFTEYLANFVRALQDIAEGTPIDIKVLLPLLKKGKVAFCPMLRGWFWTNETPKLSKGAWGIYGDCIWINGFNIKSPKNWKTSLMECGL